MPLPIPMDRNVLICREDWTKARNTEGLTLNANSKYPYSCTFSYISQFGYFLSLNASLYARFLSILGNTISCSCKIQLKLHPHNFNAMNAHGHFSGALSLPKVDWNSPKLKT